MTIHISHIIRDVDGMVFCCYLYRGLYTHIHTQAKKIKLLINERILLTLDVVRTKHALVISDLNGMSNE